MRLHLSLDVHDVPRSLAFYQKVVGLERGGHAFFTGQFEPGHYGLICFFTDYKTGAPHFAKGMVLDFDVK